MPWNHKKWHECPFCHSQTCYVMIPAKDAHVLMVASLEDQQAPLPASALCTITLQAPGPPGEDAHSYQRSPNPDTAGEGKQDHGPHPERDCVQHKFELLIWAATPAPSQVVGLRQLSQNTAFCKPGIWSKAHQMQRKKLCIS